MDRSTIGLGVLGVAVTAGAVFVVTQIPSGAERAEESGYVSHYKPPKPTEASGPRASVADQIPARGEPLRVLVAGDSISRGFYASTASSGWVPLLERGLDGQGWRATFTVVGQPGQQSWQVTPAVPERAFDLVVVELGTNDATGDAAHIDPHYSSLLAAVRKQSPDAGLICLGSWQSTYRAGLVDPSIEGECAAEDGAYVGLSDLYARGKLRGPVGVEGVFGRSDDFHPNDEGHEAIAARVLRVVG